MPNDPDQRSDHDLLGWLNKPQHFRFVAKTPFQPLIIDHFSDNPSLPGNRLNTLNVTSISILNGWNIEATRAKLFPCKTNFSPTVRYIQHLQGASFSEDRLEPTLTLSKSLVLNGYSNIPGTAHKLSPCPQVRGYLGKKTKQQRIFAAFAYQQQQKIPVPADDILK